MSVVPISGTTRLLLLLVVVVGVGVCALLVWASRFRPVQRAEKALAILAPQVGLSVIEQGASALAYFREIPSSGTGLRLCAGTVNGQHVEVGFVPLIPRRRDGATVVGIQGSSLPEVGLTRRAALSSIKYSLFGVPNGVGTKPLFGDFDAWGSQAAVQQIFTSEIQAQILAFPHKFDQVLLYRNEVILAWTGIEEDANVVRQAFRLGASLCEAANKIVH